MAYGSLVLALESGLHFAPRLFFAQSISHVLDSHLPMARFQAAGRKFEPSCGTEAVLEALARRHIQLDLNPLMQCMLMSETRQGALKIHNEHNIRSRWLTIRTEVRLGPNGSAAMVRREVPYRVEDLAICRDAHLAAMGVITSAIPLASQRPVHAPRRLARTLKHLARDIGLGNSLGAHIAEVFDEAPGTRLAALASALGCHPRTLQRRLREEGFSIDGVRRACMLLKATSLLGEPRTLTQIAHESGYADLAHMSRSFVASCSLPPSVLRAAMVAEQGDVHGEDADLKLVAYMQTSERAFAVAPGVWSVLRADPLSRR